jgi:hypothetical protein
LLAFQFYNANLLDTTCRENGEDSAAVVEDTTILTRGTGLKEACAKLEDIMTRNRGTNEWAMHHNCQFVLKKFGLMGFARRSKDDRRPGKSKPVERPSIKIQDFSIEPKETHKFLGVMIDQELRFKTHAAYAEKESSGSSSTVDWQEELRGSQLST